MVYIPKVIRIPKDSALRTYGLARLFEMANSSEITDLEFLSIIYASEGRIVRQHTSWLQILESAMENMSQRFVSPNSMSYRDFSIYHELVKLMVFMGKQPIDLAKFVIYMDFVDQLQVYVSAKEMDAILQMHINSRIEHNIKKGGSEIINIASNIPKIAPYLRDMFYDKLMKIDHTRFLSIYTDPKIIKALDPMKINLVLEHRIKGLSHFNNAMDLYFALRSQHHNFKKDIAERIRSIVTWQDISTSDYVRLLNVFSHAEIEYLVKEGIKNGADTKLKWRDYEKNFPTIFNDSVLRSSAAKIDVLFLLEMHSKYSLMSPKDILKQILSSPLRYEMLRCEDITLHIYLLDLLFKSEELRDFWSHNPKLAYRHFMKSLNAYIKEVKSTSEVCRIISYFIGSMSVGVDPFWLVKLSRRCSMLLFFKFNSVGEGLIDRLHCLVIGKNKNDRIFAKAMIKKYLDAKKEANSKRLYESVELIK